MKKLILLFLLIISTNSFGEVVSLTCVDQKNKYTTNIDFDEKNKFVVFNKEKIKAIIDDVKIFFVTKGGDNKEYGYTVNRSSGILQVVESSNFVIDSTYNCSIRKNKF